MKAIRTRVFDGIDIPDNEKQLLPKGFQRIGDIIIVKINEKIMHQKNRIADALLSFYPGCQTVLLDKGIRGKMRLPDREIIAGNETVTLHRENGCIFRLDAKNIMFSGGNLAEKERMSRLGKDETVVDMFAGIGYFSIPMAVHSKPKKIISIEINPVSSGYLRENIALNKVEDIIEPVPGDCSLLTPCGIADRVIMGYLDSHEYLQYGISALIHGGILHYHEAVPEAIEKRPIDRLKMAAADQKREVRIMGSRRIKKYSPGVWHVVVDAVVD